MNKKAAYHKFIISLLLLTNFAVGQDNEAGSKLSIGIHGAPSAATWWGNQVFTRDYRLSFTGGFAVQYAVKPRFSVRIEANYERKGFSYSFSYTDVNANSLGTGNQSFYFDYITLPLLAKFDLTKNKVKLYTNGGIYVGYLVRCGSQTSSSGPQSTISPSDYMRTDYGFIGGLGLDIPIMQHVALLLEARENLGIAAITKGGAGSIENPRNQSVALMIGIRYKL